MCRLPLQLIADGHLAGRRGRHLSLWWILSCSLFSCHMGTSCCRNTITSRPLYLVTTTLPFLHERCGQRFRWFCKPAGCLTGRCGAHQARVSHSQSQPVSYNVFNLVNRYLITTQAEVLELPDDDALEAGKDHLDDTKEETEAPDNDGQPPAKRQKLSGAQRKRAAKEEAAKKRKEKKGMNTGRKFARVHDETQLCWKAATGKACPMQRLVMQPSPSQINLTVHHIAAATHMIFQHILLGSLVTFSSRQPQHSRPRLPSCRFIPRSDTTIRLVSPRRPRQHHLWI